MGWLYGCDDRKSLVEHLTKDATWSNGTKFRTLAKFFSGSDLWAVQETETPDGTVDRFIILYMLRNSGFGYNRQWGYKDVSESMGPCAKTCPVKFLDMVPDPGGYATEWRKEVREYWASRRLDRKVKDGDVYQLRDGISVSGVPLKQVTIKMRGKRMLGDGYIRITRPFLAKWGTFLYNKYEDNKPDETPTPREGDLHMALA